MMFIKLSIGVFLLRLAAQKVYTWILRISIFVVTIWSLAIFFWNIFQCSPVDKQWDYRITGGRCVSPGEIVSAAYAMTALTVLSDWLYVSTYPIVWRGCVLITSLPGSSSDPDALEGQDVEAGQDHSYPHLESWDLVSSYPHKLRVGRFS